MLSLYTKVYLYVHVSCSCFIYLAIITSLFNNMRFGFIELCKINPISMRLSILNHRSWVDFYIYITSFSTIGSSILQIYFIYQTATVLFINIFCFDAIEIMMKKICSTVLHNYPN